MNLVITPTSKTKRLKYGNHRNDHAVNLPPPPPPQCPSLSDIHLYFYIYFVTDTTDWWVLKETSIPPPWRVIGNSDRNERS